MISPPAQRVLDELNEIIGLDGAHLVIDEASGSAIDLSLDLSASECPECVLPHDLLVEMLTTRLAQADPDVTTVRLEDPRPAEGTTPFVS